MWRGICLQSFLPPPECVLTSGRELFGVDDLGGVLLTGAEFDAAAHHGEGSPGKHRTGGRGGGKQEEEQREE